MRIEGKEEKKIKKKRFRNLPDRVSACSTIETELKGGWCEMRQAQEKDMVDRVELEMGDCPPSRTWLTRVATQDPEQRHGSQKAKDPT